MSLRRRSPSPHGLFFLAFCVLGAPALITGAGCSSEAQAGNPTRPDAQQASQLSGYWRQGDGSAVATDYDPEQSLAPMIEAVLPAVVSIRSIGRQGLFGGDGVRGIGSGFVISADGLVVTNHHVAAGGDRFEVHLPDGRRFKAEVIGSDPQTDIAVMRLEGAKELETVVFGGSDGLRVGDWVVAMGSPMGLEQTVTRGIISAKGRGSLGLYSDGYADFLQTDAAINPGNSGGPLFNLAGEVVGINTAVGGHDGLGFAIPIDQAKAVIPKLIEDGHMVRGWMGVVGGDEEPAFGVAPQLGAKIGEVHAGTPAATAGLQAGDVIVTIDGKNIADFEDLRTRVGEYSPNDELELELLRVGKRQKLKLHLAERPSAADLQSLGTTPGSKPTPTPESTPKPKPTPKPGADLYGGGQPARLGVEVAQTPEGVVIEAVVEGGVGYRLGLRRGDQIQAVNGDSIDSVAEILEALEGDRKRVEIEVQRGNASHTAVLSVG